MTVNELKNELQEFINRGFGDNRIILNIDDGIRSALNEVDLYTKEVQGENETFVRLSDGGDYAEGDGEYE
jgi:hypothetical protein